jgi:phospholipid/cholesterol/gamma-HCH transport system substrate-binding protein
MEVLARGAENPNTPMGTLTRDEEAGTDLKGTLDNLHLGSRLLVEDLQAAQHNFLLRGYFKKTGAAEAVLPIQTQACVPGTTAVAVP